MSLVLLEREPYYEEIKAYLIRLVQKLTKLWQEMNFHTVVVSFKGPAVRCWNGFQSIATIGAAQNDPASYYFTTCSGAQLNAWASRRWPWASLKNLWYSCNSCCKAQEPCQWMVGTSLCAKLPRLHSKCSLCELSDINWLWPRHPPVFPFSPSKVHTPP